MLNYDMLIRFFLSVIRLITQVTLLFSDEISSDVTDEEIMFTEAVIKEGDAAAVIPTIK